MADYNKIYKELYDNKDNQAKLATQKNTYNAIYDNQAKTVQDTYTQQIADSEADYEDAYRENAVQKKVNEFYIAEDMANMGLTNSGLNRTQITANRLSYANNKANIDRQRQSMVDSLTREMTTRLADIENERSSTMQSLQDSYDQSIASSANSIYTAEKEAEAEQTKAYYDYLSKQEELKAEAEKKASLLYTYQGESQDDSDYNVFLDSNGKLRTVQKGYNPYTGDNNLKTYAAEAKDIGFFSNGYQPKGLVSEGGKFFKVTVGGQVVKYNYKGKEQNLWYSPNGNYFLWDGSKNQYIKIPTEQVNQIKNMYT